MPRCRRCAVQFNARTAEQEYCATECFYLHRRRHVSPLARQPRGRAVVELMKRSDWQARRAKRLEITV